MFSDRLDASRRRLQKSREFVRQIEIAEAMQPEANGHHAPWRRINPRRFHLRQQDRMRAVDCFYDAIDRVDRPGRQGGGAPRAVCGVDADDLRARRRIGPDHATATTRRAPDLTGCGKRASPEPQEAKKTLSFYKFLIERG